MIEITAMLLYAIIFIVLLPGILGIIVGYSLNPSLLSIILFFFMGTAFGLILFVTYANKLGV